MFWQPREVFHPWPKDQPILDIDRIKLLYAKGFAGATYNSDAVAEFIMQQGYPDGEKVVHDFGLADTGAGKLCIPFLFVMELYPNCWPGVQGQARGDCVSWSTRNAALTTMCGDIASGKPDEKTGQPEEAPEVSAEGIADGVLSTESFYWWRGYNGDGWMCPAAATVATKKSGLFLRKNYSDLGVDLTRYSGRNAGIYGAKAPGREIAEVADDHLIHQATSVSSVDSVRDLLWNGYGVSTCGSEGYSNKRDQNGMSKRSGSWAHAMAAIGVDDRDIAKQTFGEPVVLILNSWAIWNSGPRDIIDSVKLVPPEKKEKWIKSGLVNPSTGAIMIPDGSFWTPWSQCKNREFIGFSGVNGWPKKSLPWPDRYI